MDIELKLGREQWHHYIRRNYDDAFSKYRLQIHDRDQYTCQLCGFQSTVYMDVLNKDGIYSHNHRDNLVTACPFCVQCHFMEMVGKVGYGGGILVYLPEMTQIELNGLCHALFCAMANTTEYADESEGIYNSLRLRAKVIERQYGEGLSQPGMLGQMLVDTPMQDREQITAAILKDLRLLPLLNKFEKEVNTWAKVSFDQFIDLGQGGGL